MNIKVVTSGKDFLNFNDVVVMEPHSNDCLENNDGRLIIKNTQTLKTIAVFNEYSWLYWYEA